MSATYSSFMTTRFYSPVFNTALFDGPLRIYFSQSYEAVALKIYHLLQTQHHDVWQRLKQATHTTKEHLFLLIYPELSDLQMVFGNQSDFAQTQDWEEGLAIGVYMSQNEEFIQRQVEYLVKAIQNWVTINTQNEIKISV